MLPQYTPVSLVLMGLFITVFVCVLGFWELFFHRMLKQAFPLPLIVTILLFTGYAVFLLLPFILNSSADIAGSKVGVAAAWVFYIGLGFLFYFFFTGLVLIGIQKVISFFFLWQPGGRLMFFLTCIPAVLIIAYGFIEKDRLSVTEVNLTTAKLPPSHKPVVIVAVADIHFNQIQRLAFANRLTKLIEKQKPDILISAGDFCDKGFQDENKIARLFRNIPAPLGKYAVFGNHEFFTDPERAETFLQKAGFTILHNTASLTPDAAVSVIGIDDTTGKRFGFPPPDDKTLLAESVSTLFTVFVKHQPRIQPGTADLFDLQISGHTHAGQLFPWNFFTWLAYYPYLHGLYSLDSSTLLYLTSGAGTWGPPMRVGAPPEIVVLTVYPEKAN